MAKLIRTHAVATREETQAGDVFDRLRQRVQKRWQEFCHGPVTPLSSYEWEKDLKALFDEAGRELLEEEYNRLQPEDKKQAAPRLRYHKETYRINKRTKATIATSFGPIRLWSWLYLNEEAGEPGLHPLHVQLGIVAGVTPLLADRSAHWAVTHSQAEVRQLLFAEHGLRWSNDRLRRVLREFRRGVEGFRTAVQAERLLGWLKEAERSRGRHRPVLAVGRDGVMVPIRQQGYEEASAATVSVYDRRRKRLGTVYLGHMPEPHQVTMTAELTGLVTAVLKEWSGPLPRLVYVTDKGQAQDDYYRRVLRRMHHPRHTKQRLTWEWVLDFFHVCSYVGKLSEALFGAFATKGPSWFGRMRHWLRDRHQGVAQILRSAMQHYQRQKMSKVAQREFWKAYRYLRKHSRWMDYPRYRRQGMPIGSGVTEAACKTVFTQRLKRSGMRWSKEFAQVIVDLRVICLSGIWDDVVRRELNTRPLPEGLQRLSSQPSKRETVAKAA